MASTVPSDAPEAAATVRPTDATGGQAGDGATAAAADGVQEHDDDSDEGDEDAAEDGDDGAAADDGANMTSKQKKKKKSKAAAKLRKKLGLGGGGGDDKATTSTAAAADASLRSGGGSKSLLSDDDVTQLQQAIAREQGPQAAARADRATLEKLMKAINSERSAMLKDQDAKQRQYKTLAEHKFWRTQPVAKPNDKPLLSEQSEGPIEPNAPREQVRQEPYPLPSDFEWSPIDIDDAAELKEVYDLLSANYVEDVDSSLRFNYSPEFLHWVLKHPGYHTSWHIGVRVKSTRKLVAFISAIPHELRVRQQAYPSSEVNFLCVHKKLRSKRLTPVLIKEVTRQCHLTGVFQAIYTGGIVIPTPIACARYYHRTINAPKLLEIGFSGLRPGQTKEQYVAQYAVPDATRLAGLREIEEGDVAAVGKLMRRFLRRFDMAARFTDDEVRHLLLSGKSSKGHRQVTWTYVVQDPASGAITDMVSFYSLPSTILDNDKHSILEAAYLFYYATDAAFGEEESVDDAAARASSSSSSSSSSPPLDNLHRTNLSDAEQKDEANVVNWAHESTATKAKLRTRLNALVGDVLVIAKQQGFDVLNCLTVMDNPLFLAELKFGAGDGFLRHYLFNWRIRPVAGGMGARPGETDLDPVVQYAKVALEAEPDSANLSEAERKRRLAAIHPHPELGSGTGIVMV